MTREEKLAYQRKYYQEHKDEILAKHRAYRKANPDYDRKYYQEHKDHIKEVSHKYYLDHRQEVIDKAKTYQAAHKEERQRYLREYFLGHKDKYKDYHRKYYLKNREWILLKNRCKYRGYDLTLFELRNPNLFNNTYSGCLEYSDCLTCPRPTCIYDQGDNNV